MMVSSIIYSALEGLTYKSVRKVVLVRGGEVGENRRNVWRGSKGNEE